MKISLLKKGIFVLLAMLLIVPLGAMGCKRNVAPAGTEIKIGVMGGLTGVGSASIVPLMEELEKIFEYINEVEGGINGATIDWVYRGGDFQHYFHVYQRSGEPCLICGETIERIIVNQRGTHYCPSCQPEVSE